VKRARETSTRPIQRWKAKRIARTEAKQPNGDGFTVSTGNISNLSAKRQLIPTSVSLGCFLKLSNGLSVAVQCSFRVTPFKEFVAFSPTSYVCQFMTVSSAHSTSMAGLTTTVGSPMYSLFDVRVGTVQPCMLPPKWRGVEKTSFQIELGAHCRT